MKKIISAVLGGVLIAGSFATAEVLKAQGSASDQTLEQKLLREVVARSDIYTSIEYPYDGQTVSQTRLIADVQSGALDIISLGANASLERQLQAVYVPIYRGTLGMRIGIVEQDKRGILSGVRDLDDLTEFTACQGKTWADTEILEANGLKIAKSLKYPNIFLMVEADRCDYFPRAIFEPWSEIAARPALNLTVDETVLLRYRMPLLFFVHLENQELARYLTESLEAMYREGVFEEIFFRDERVRQALELSRLESRVVIDLINPNETSQVKAIPPEFWLDPLEVSVR